MNKMTRNIFAIVLPAFLTFNALAATVATVNGKAITDDDLKQLVSTVPAAKREGMLKDPMLRAQLIQNLIDQELMVQDAAAKKIDSSKEFKDAYANFRKQAMVNLLVEKQLGPKITEAAVKDYYNKNKNRYSTDEVHAQHILLASEAEAQSVLAEVKKAGVDFQKVAEAKSKDPSVKNNRGDLGFFGRELYDPSFVDASFSAKEGDIVGPVKSAFGYHVIKIVGRKVGKVQEYAEVEQKVRSDVQRNVLIDYVSALKRKAKIKQ